MRLHLILSLSAILLTCSCMAEKIEIQLINGYSDEPIADFKLNFVNKDGELVDSQTSDENGFVTHKLKETVRVVEDKKMKYFKTFPLSISGQFSDKLIVHYFYPTKTAEHLILQWEKNNPGKHVPDFSLLDDVKIESASEDEDKVPEEVVVEEEKDMLDEEEPKKVVDYPDQEATFPGGVSGMKKFLANNILYPEISMELGDQGKVFVEFIVEKNGLISQVKVLRGVSSEIDAESIRVVRSMPVWSPAESAGEVVRARCRIPINYILR